MKINQVEELVGITKKNIRFYEEQGLLRPERDPQNGYREYSLVDVEQLRRIKLFRQLGFPCEQIRLMQEGKLSFDDSMQKRIAEIENHRKDLEHMSGMCAVMSAEVDDFSDINASEFLEKMKQLEKGGARFMDVRTTDVRKRMTGAVIAAVVMIAFMLAMIGLMIWANSIDPIPRLVLGFFIVIFGAFIVGIVIALSQRIRELEGGELYEADKY